MKINESIYRVQYQGLITEMKLISINDNNVGVFKIRSLISIKDDIWLEKPREFWGTQTIPLNLFDFNGGEYYEKYFDAKIKSKERFDKEVCPNGDYKVARYFDNVFETYVTGILSKKDAKEKAKEMNGKPKHYIYYDIRKV